MNNIALPSKPVPLAEDSGNYRGLHDGLNSEAAAALHGRLPRRNQPALPPHLVPGLIQQSGKPHGRNLAVDHIS